MKREMVFGMLFGAIAAGGFAAESDGIFSYRLGQFEIHMLVETERAGNTGVLIGADDALLKQYIPAAGFKSSTNTFLVKTPGRNIVVDTGFGQAIFEKIRKLGVTPEQVDAVLITHMHGDHIGGLAKDGKALFPAAKIYLAAKEKDFWTGNSVNRGAIAALAPYGARVETFEPGDLTGRIAELLPGISPIAAYGHTPGHTAFLLESGGAKFLIWGDIMHVELVQFPAPDISVTYDSDPKTAAVSRRQILDYAAKNKIPIGGMHLVYPAAGTVEASGSGYRLIPAR